MKISSIFAALGLLLVTNFSAVRSEEQPVRKGNTISAAVIIPLTGNFSEWGDLVRMGLELAKTRLAEDGILVDLRYEDTTGDVKTAVTAYQRVKESNKPQVVFSFGSGVGIALSPLVNQDHIIQVGVATNSNKYRSENDYTFRLCGLVEGEAEYASKFVHNNLHLNTVGIVKTENDYGDSAAALFEEDFRKLGGTVDLNESMKIGETDFRSLITKAKNKNLKAIFLPAYPREAENFLRQAKELDYNSEFIVGMASFGDSQLFNNKKLIEGKVFLAGEIELTTADSKDHRYDFAKGKQVSDKQASEISRNQFSAYAYDALLSVGKAAAQCPDSVTADCLKDKLYSMDEFQGVSGLIKFDKFGDPGTTYTAFRAINSELVPVQKAP